MREIKECAGINCSKYNGRCIAYGEIPKDCPLFQDNSCIRNCCNDRAIIERQLGRDVVLKWLSSHLVKQDDWRLPAFTITQGEFEAQLKDWGINNE
jgi:hypothetical protein